MYRRRTLIISAASVLFGHVVMFANDALAQSAKDIAGTYTIVSVTVMKGENKIEPFGPNPKGAMILDASGRYIVTLMRPGLPKFASDNRDTGTTEENKAIVTGSFTHFGRYAVTDGFIIFRLESSTFPNWDGQEQKRSLAIAGDELKYTLTSTIGGTSTVVWKRVK